MNSSDKNIHTLAQGAGFGLVGKFLGRFLSVLGDIIAARILGPAVFGLYSIGWTLFRLIEIIGPIGLDRGVLRFIPRFVNKDQGSLKGTIFQALGLSFGCGLILGIILYVGAPWLAHSVFKKPELIFILRFFAFGFPVGALLPVIASVTRADHSVKYAVMVQDIGQPLLSLLFLAIFYFNGERLLGVLYADIISYILAMLWGLFYIRRLYPAIFISHLASRQVSQELLKYSFPVAMGGLFSALIYWVDRLFVGFYRTEVEIGVYQAASQVSLVFAVILSGLSTVLAPQFSRLYHQNDRIGLRQVYSIGNKWGLYIGLPIIAVIIMSPQRIITVLYGVEYSDAWFSMVILLIGQLINLATGASAPLLLMVGGHKIWFILTIIAFSLDLLLIYWLTPIFGINGAAIATSISVSFLFAFVLLAVRWKFQLWPYDRRYSKGFVAILVVLVFSWIVGKFDLPDISIIAIQAIGAVTIFVFILIILKLDSEDLIFISLLRDRFIRVLGSNREI
jgi:O-antigen/teichoic acid export membrane protein